MMIITFKYKKNPDLPDFTRPIVCVTNPFPMDSNGNMVPRIAGYDINHIPLQVFNQFRGYGKMPLKNLQEIITSNDYTDEEKLNVQCFIDAFRQYKFENMSEVKIIKEGRY